ncbi:hypothetical protein ACFX14_026555 [Malus domestica]
MTLAMAIGCLSGYPFFSVKVVGAMSVGTFWAGVILCIEKALEQSGMSREDVNYINVHATSTPAGDLKEYNALIHCFGQNPDVTTIHC